MSESPPSQPEQQDKQQSSYQKESPTGFQLGVAALVLGTSAGFLFYTKKTDSMLRTMNKITENQLRNRPPKAGPPTKEQWEKIKPRIDKDEFF